MEKNAKRKIAQYVKALLAIPRPEGFEVTTGEGFMGSFEETWERRENEGPMHWVRFKSEDTAIIFNVSWDKSYTRHHDKKKIAGCVSVSGHTTYKAGGKWWSKSRRGIDDSFYIGGHYGEEKDPAVVLQEQIAYCNESRERTAQLIAVPGLTSINISPERKVEHTKALKAGKSVRLTPAGFGTGYQLYPANARGLSRYARLAPPATVEFFGAGPLRFETLDCD